MSELIRVEDRCELGEFLFGHWGEISSWAEEMILKERQRSHLKPHPFRMTRGEARAGRGTFAKLC